MKVFVKIVAPIFALVLLGGILFLGFGGIPIKSEMVTKEIPSDTFPS